MSLIPLRNTIYISIQEGFQRIREKPLEDLLGVLLFLFGAMTGILFGFSALLYLWYCSHHRQLKNITSIFLFIQRLQGTQRLTSAFWLGLSIWGIFCLPILLPSEIGLLLWWLLIQPFWLALFLVDRFDLSLHTVFKTLIAFLQFAPKQFMVCIILGLLTFCGLFFFGIGILLTLPIGVYAELRLLDVLQAKLSIAIQKAY